MDVEQFIRLARDWKDSKEVLGRFGGHSTVLTVIDAHDRQTIGIIPDAGPANRVAPLVKQFLEAHHGVAFMLVGEMWISSNIACTKPSRDPGRTEALVMISVHPKYREGRILEFSTNAYGEVVFGIERLVPESDCAGALINLLRDPEPRNQ